MVQPIEFADNLVIPDKVWNSDRWQRLLDLCAVLTCYVKDVYSFEKELKETKDMKKMFNSVAFIANELNKDTTDDKVIKDDLLIETFNLKGPCTSWPK